VILYYVCGMFVYNPFLFYL